MVVDERHPRWADMADEDDQESVESRPSTAAEGAPANRPAARRRRIRNSVAALREENRRLREHINQLLLMVDSLQCALASSLQTGRWVLDTLVLCIQYLGDASGSGYASI